MPTIEFVSSPDAVRRAGEKTQGLEATARKELAELQSLGETRQVLARVQGMAYARYDEMNVLLDSEWLRWVRTQSQDFATGTE